MNLDAIRDALLSSIEQQKEADLANVDTNYLLNQQKLMYQNEARGSLYSGQPTWERGQLAAQNVADRANVEESALKSQLKVWDSITDTLDKINSYNKAAASLTSTTTTTNSNMDQALQQLYNSLVGEE